MHNYQATHEQSHMNNLLPLLDPYSLQSSIQTLHWRWAEERNNKYKKNIKLDSWHQCGRQHGSIGHSSDFYSPDFPKLFERCRLLLCTMIVHDKIPLLIVPVSVPARFFLSIWHLKNRTASEDG